MIDHAGKKKAAYAALVRQHSLKKKVEYAPVIFEVSGGFPDAVSQLLSKATEVAGKNKVKLAAAPSRAVQESPDESRSCQSLEVLCDVCRGQARYAYTVRCQLRRR